MNIAMIYALFASLLVFGQAAHRASSAGNSGSQFEIGHIYFYGYGGLDPGRVRHYLPVHRGEMLDVQSFENDRNLIRRAVATETGRPATDVAFVCCDRDRHLLIYIGLGGASSRKLTLRGAPVGNDKLAGNGLELYRADMAALAKAVTNGSTGEDDSEGYALANDSTAHSIQLEMRAYALNRGAKLERVLRDSASPEQREASACLLGYAQRSDVQIRALISASTDPDVGVRNGAVRALAVLLSTKDMVPSNLDIRPFVSLLWSGQWMDRNKASFVLTAITKDSSPAILHRLHETAMPPLVEGARWDSVHADAFLLILGRIAGTPRSQLQNEIRERESGAIIDAAEKTR